MHDRHLTCSSYVTLFTSSSPVFHLIESRIFLFELCSSFRCHSSYPDFFLYWVALICSNLRGGKLECSLIELEAERCSLDSRGAFTDEYYCCPAVTRSMHSDDTLSQMWVGSALASKARSPIYSNLHRDSNGKNRKMSLLAAHICRGAIDQKRPASHRTFAFLSAAG